MTTKRTMFGLGAVVLAAALAGCAGAAESSKASPSSASDVGAPAAAPPGEPGGGFFDAPPPPPVVAAPAPAAEAAPSIGTKGAAGRARMSEKAEAPPTDRPGLGTEWGETRVSRIDTVSFVRGDATTPFATAGFFYNDEQGARAMASANGFQRTAGGPISMASGAVTVGLRDEGGRFLSGYTATGKNFVVGEAGQRYTIAVHNNTDARLEIVLSVDGLDVMDGKEASFRKRGYILDPRADLDVDGFRQTTDTVAAFRFGSVRNSYANQKHGDTRNVGVVGVALFQERGTNPFAILNGDIQRREHANPFPGQFATAP
jgi:hypothetical protein